MRNFQYKRKSNLMQTVLLKIKRKSPYRSNILARNYNNHEHICHDKVIQWNILNELDLKCKNKVYLKTWRMILLCKF